VVGATPSSRLKALAKGGQCLPAHLLSIISVGKKNRLADLLNQSDTYYVDHTVKIGAADTLLKSLMEKHANR
jgi:hypothetical protein